MTIDYSNYWLLYILLCKLSYRNIRVSLLGGKKFTCISYIFYICAVIILDIAQNSGFRLFEPHSLAYSFQQGGALGKAVRF